MKGRHFEKTQLMMLLKNFRIAVLVLMLAEIIFCEGGVNPCNTKTIEGQSAKITCSLNKNAVRKNLFIEHLSGDPFDFEIVVFCQLNQGRYVCKIKDGYQVSDNITDHLTLTIRNSQSKHAGIYMFGGFQLDPLERIQCRLTVMGDPNLNKQTSARPNEKKILTDKAVGHGQHRVHQISISGSLESAVVAVGLNWVQRLQFENSNRSLGEIKEDEMSASTSTITIPIVLVVVVYTTMIIIMTKMCRYPCRIRRRARATPV